ncbi:MAG: helix-hairpin-helix domain-containing protein [Nitrospirales bacterium]|nr:MAG: helix-hairpin-helix domain-containing protein [Nitrospirales bacterium]
MIRPLNRFPVLMLALFLSMSFMYPITWAEAAGMKADINSASITQLEAVIGIGHDTAQNILDYKKEHGNFTSMDELEAVSGVGKVRLQALNEAFMVEQTKESHKKTSMK